MRYAIIATLFFSTAAHADGCGEYAAQLNIAGQMGLAANAVDVKIESILLTGQIDAQSAAQLKTLAQDTRAAVETYIGATETLKGKSQCFSAKQETE